VLGLPLFCASFIIVRGLIYQVYCLILKPECSSALILFIYTLASSLSSVLFRNSYWAIFAFSFVLCSFFFLLLFLVVIKTMFNSLSPSFLGYKLPRSWPWTASLPVHGASEARCKHFTRTCFKCETTAIYGWNSLNRKAQSRHVDFEGWRSRQGVRESLFEN